MSAENIKIQKTLALRKRVVPVWYFGKVEMPRQIIIDKHSIILDMPHDKHMQFKLVGSNCRNCARFLRQLPLQPGFSIHLECCGFINCEQSDDAMPDPTDYCCYLYTPCNFDCNHWYESNLVFCVDCMHFKAIAKCDASPAELKFMEERDLDILYACNKKHVIKHAYSGCCDEYIGVKDE